MQAAEPPNISFADPLQAVYALMALPPRLGLPSPEWFWLRVAIGDGCWEWLNATLPSGYGVIHHQGQLLRTHRVAYQLVYGHISPALSVCHRCDNRPCARPDHLYAGTHRDNMRDRRDRGRYGYRPEIRIQAHVLQHQHRLSAQEIAAFFSVTVNTARRWAASPIPEACPCCLIDAHNR